MNKKILFVITSHGTKGNTGQPTGYYLGEVTHAWKELRDAGYEIDFVSPKGGESPVDGMDLKDPVNKEFMEDQQYQYKITHSMRPSDVNVNEYDAIYFAGGHGTMWDFPDNGELQKLASQIYENGGVVGAVCHGPSALVNVKLNNGRYLVEGKKVNAFTDEEEKEVKLDNVVPFMLESKLIERGAKFEKAGKWQEKVVVDDRLVTGQNPASAKGVGKEMVRVLERTAVLH